MQNISIPTGRTVIEHSKGEVALKSQFFLKESINNNWNFQRDGQGIF